MCYVSSVRGLEVTLEGREVQLQGVGYSGCAMCSELIDFLLQITDYKVAPQRGRP